MPQHLRERADTWASQSRCWSKITPRLRASERGAREVLPNLMVNFGSERKFCFEPMVRSSNFVTLTFRPLQRK